ncbi:hypothetical protein MKW92_051651 [Papaver armeniacum]|nr:hypothetical protein MKW92_051651 [Papaver armeniacum]
MEAQPKTFFENEKYHLRRLTNYQEEEGIDINNSPQRFSLDYPILIKDSDHNRLNTQELNLIDSFNVGSSSSSSSTDHNTCEETELEETADNQEELTRVYSCDYCQRKFFRCQALGGHQNAHKQERIVEKRDRLRRLNSFHFADMRSNHQLSYNRHNRFSSMASLPPVHGSLSSNNRSISSVSEFVLPSSRSDASHHNLYGKNDQRDEWLSSSSRLPIMVDQPAIFQLPSFVHGSLQHFPRVNDGLVGGGSFLLQGGGLKGSRSDQEDSKKIDLALKL